MELVNGNVSAVVESEESKLPDLEEAKAEDNEEAKAENNEEAKAEDNEEVNAPIAASLSKTPKSKRPLIRKIKAKRPIDTTGMHSHCPIYFKARFLIDPTFRCIQTRTHNLKTTRRTTRP